MGAKSQVIDIGVARTAKRKASKEAKKLARAAAKQGAKARKRAAKAAAKAAAAGREARAGRKTSTSRDAKAHPAGTHRFMNGDGSKAAPHPKAGGVDAYPAQERRHALRLGWVPRAIDDREIALQKESRVFFQISGAGHEALLLALARDLRPGYDWFFPYYRDRALVLGLGVTPLEILLQAVGSADDPASGGRQMPCHWGDAERHIVTQSSATGTQCLPAVGCAEAGRYIVRRDLPGCVAHGDEVTYVSLGEGATSEGEFWESLNTACRLALPVLYVVADNGYAISVRATDQAPAPISELVAGFRGLAVARMDGCDYFEVRKRGAEAIQRVRAGQGPGLIHATVTRPYSHSLS